MRNLLAATLLSFFAVMNTGCGATFGLVRDSITQVQIQKAGFEVVKTNISATVVVRSILCIFPVTRNPTADLMRALHEQAHLGPNQMFINLRQDATYLVYLGFVCDEELTLSADVIEFGTAERLPALGSREVASSPPMGGTPPPAQPRRTEPMAPATNPAAAKADHPELVPVPVAFANCLPVRVKAGAVMRSAPDEGALAKTKIDAESNACANPESKRGFRRILLHNGTSGFVAVEDVLTAQ
jgi:hypothetical protein